MVEVSTNDVTLKLLTVLYAELAVNDRRQMSRIKAVLFTMQKRADDPTEAEVCRIAHSFVANLLEQG